MCIEWCLSLFILTCMSVFAIEQFHTSIIILSLRDQAVGCELKLKASFFEGVF